MNIINIQKVNDLKENLWWLEEIYCVNGNSCCSSDYINCKTKALEFFTGDAFDVIFIFDYLDFFRSSSIAHNRTYSEHCEKFKISW